MESQIQSKLSLKNFNDYLNKVDKSNLHFVEGWTNKKEHINNTFNLYFTNIQQKQIFIDSELEELKDWFMDISKLHKSVDCNNIYPKANNIKTEAIIFNDKLILKECFNLLHLIYQYHNAYILKIEREDELQDTIYHISQDKHEIQKKYNKFDKESTNYRKNKKHRAPFVIAKKVLKLLLSKKYSFRAKYYINSLALNFNIYNWDKLFNDEDEIAKEILFEVINYFMYSNLSEKKIKNSLMILVYTFLTTRLRLKEKDSLSLTNRLCNSILYDIDNKLDYRKSELSKKIYAYRVFNYLPIFAHENPKYTPKLNDEQEKKILQTIKKHSFNANKSFKYFDEKYFIDTMKNSHVNYVMHDLIFLYNSKEE
ncbi:MAG: hypothetical protein PHF17_06645 [Arcobacteraceae bacterium]|nr:hypothetical protein [Arcobacteraceae bacterium]